MHWKSDTTDFALEGPAPKYLAMSVYVPYKGTTLYWFMASASLEHVQKKLAREEALFDGIIRFRCTPEGTYPLKG